MPTRGDIGSKGVGNAGPGAPSDMVASDDHPPLPVVATFGDSDGALALTRTLAETSRGPVLVYYDPAIVTVALGIAAGQVPSSALDGWKKQAQAFITTYRRQRRRVVFVSMTAATRDPAGLQAALANSFPSRDTAAALALAQSPREVAAWHMAIAAHAVASDAFASRLEGELEAAALPLAPVAVDADAAFRELSETKAAHDADLEKMRRRLTHAAEQTETATANLRTYEEVQARVLSDESDLLRPQLTELQSELSELLRAETLARQAGARTAMELANANAEVAKLAQGLAQEKNRVAELQVQLAELENRKGDADQSRTAAEREVLLLQLADLRAELQEHVSQLDAEKRSTAKIQAELEAMRAKELAQTPAGQSSTASTRVSRLRWPFDRKKDR